MEESPAASESGAISESALFPGRSRSLIAAILGLSLALLPTFTRADDALTRIRASGRLAFGSDAEGGGPYAYPDPANPTRVTGFEVELIERLCGPLGPRPELVQGQWDMLLPVLDTGRVDVVLNGYEWSRARADRYRATRPYYVFQLQMMAPKGGVLREWGSLTDIRPGGGRWRVGVLGGSAAETFANEKGGEKVEVVAFTGATDAMMAVKNGQIDATLQDLPAARFYGPRFPTLELAGDPVGRGFYVIYLRKGDESLARLLDRGIADLDQSGDLKRLYERWGIWTPAQEELGRLGEALVPSSEVRRESLRGWPLIRRYAPTLLASAGLTVFLSVTSMPIAMAIGLVVAIGRLYGPRPVRVIAAIYVEILRGTPLMLQLFVLFFLLPELDISLPPMVAAIAGLAINYSAYEAENYRAGLLAIPLGQMEASLALGMSRFLALRRIVVPQAVRLVIPPVTNDFIALFKDTSVCSVITLVELTKRYSILANSTGGVVEFAIASAALYLAMSLPLSWLSRWSERRLGLDPATKKGAKGR